MRSTFIVFTPSLLLTSRAVGRNYKRPPVQYRQPLPAREPPEKASLSDLAWAELTSFFGVQSPALSELITGPARDQNTSPTGVLPVFNAGQLRIMFA